MRLSIFSFLSILLLFAKIAKTQDASFAKVSAPVPNSASIAKFGEYPVSEYTGVPSINIPIQSLEIGDIKMNISLSYHSSGIKVEEDASWVGLAWALNAGGIITRTIRGEDDFGSILGYFKTSAQVPNYEANPSSSNYNNYIGPNDTYNLSYLNKICNSEWDGEPDIFYYSLPGLSGKFIIDRPQNVGEVFYIRQIEKTDVRIEMLSTNGSGFRITATDGTVYEFFLKSGSSLKYSKEITILSVTDNPSDPYVDGNYQSHPTTLTSSTWYLTKIISPKGRVVNFEYKDEEAYTLPSRNFIQKKFIENRVLWVDNSINCSYTGTNFLDQLKCSFSKQRTMNSYFLSAIKFDGGKVEFITSNRDDIWWVLPNSTKPPQKLDRIDVFNTKPDGSYALINKCIFSNTYFEVPNSTEPTFLRKRLKLEKISFAGSNNLITQEYNFQYNSTLLPDKKSFKQDNYGYYNGISNSLFPTGRYYLDYKPGGLFTDFTAGGDRSVNETAMKACILEKIIYPTGGYTVFDYESNDYYNANISANVKAGGLRIKTIKNYTHGSTAATVQRYVYDVGGISTGKLMSDLRYYYFEFVLNKRNCSSGGVVFHYQTDEDVFIQRVGSSVRPLGSAASGNPVGYSKVFVYNQETPGIEKTELQFQNNNEIVPTYPRLPNMPNAIPFGNGLLLKKIIYKNVNNIPTLQKETEFIYQLSESNIKCLQVFMCQGQGNLPANVKYYDLKTGTGKLTDEIQKEYSNSTVLTEQTTYEYITSYLNPSSVKKVNSKNVEVKIDNLYPYNFSGTTVYDEMVNKNMIAPVIEKVQTHVTPYKELSRNKTNFLFWQGNAMILPATFQKSLLANTLETEVTINAYDTKGNMLQTTGKDGVVNSFIWDNSKTNMLAKAINSPVTDIFHTSFEDTDGNTSLGDSKTGKLSRTGSYSKILSNLSNGQYILSYWQKIGSTWTFQASSVPVTGNTYTINFISPIQVDEVRFYPSKAQMTTYTYEPLIGMTSQCDVNNRITYYEYDGFQRLILVRDQDKNILKKICYNYAGQPESCTQYTNAPQSQSIRKNCTGCQVGSYVTYTVPAGAYISNSSQADADQQALNDINANGQVYANTYGTCTAPPNAGANARSFISSNAYIIFTNNCTGVDYSYTLNANSMQSFGPFPAGTYTVYMSSSGTYTYMINGYSQTSSSPVNFFNIVINSAASIQVTN